MADATGPIRPTRLWRLLSLDRRTTIARAFWADPEATSHAEAIQAISQRRHFRPQKVRALSPEIRTRYLASTPELSAGLVLQALVSYHLQQQRPMMAAFLDALGMPHEDGILADDAPGPAEGELERAAKALAAAYPAQDVRLYFQTLLAHDPDTWGGLATVASGFGDEPTDA